MEYNLSGIYSYTCRLYWHLKKSNTLRENIPEDVDEGKNKKSYASVYMGFTGHVLSVLFGGVVAILSSAL
jgi:hypothetical protein